MPAMGEDWIIEAEDYALEEYGLSLEQLGFTFDDGSVYFECPQYWVDNAFKDYDFTPEEEGEPPITWLENASKVVPR